MKSEQLKFKMHENVAGVEVELSFQPNLIFVFASAEFFNEPHILNEISSRFPDSELVGSSTGGQILGNNVTESELVLTAIEFQSTRIVSRSVELTASNDFYEKGFELGEKLDQEGLRHVFLLSVSLATSGDNFLEGLQEALPEHVSITGGLAGDTAKFDKDFVLDVGNSVSNSVVKVLGFYGEELEITYSSVGGWEEIQPRLRVTSSEGNVLFKLNNKPALDVYMDVLGMDASDLQDEKYKYPFSMSQEGESEPVIRSVIGLNEDDRSIVFGGEIKEGDSMRVTKASVDRVVEGAREAAEICQGNLPETHDVKFVLVVSCVGRKLFLQDYVSEEIEKVIDQVGDKATCAGFYSRGEIAPFAKKNKSRLHNQTMTLTMFSEKKKVVKQKSDNPLKGFFNRLLK